MDVLLDALRLLGGGLILYLGAEWLVKGSAGLAHAFGVKPLVIGLTVVAYGTSAPELAVSSAAIINDSSQIVNGNVLGSCVANIALILGITALVKPPSVDPRLIKREIPVLLLSVAAVPFIFMDGHVAIWEALTLLGLSIAFTVVTLTSSAEESPMVDVSELSGDSEDDSDEPIVEGGRLRLTGITLVGLGLLVVGGEVFVDGAKGMALTLGLSELLVGQTVVAVGTSLPELAASIVAAARGYSSLAVGNVIGSNIFNIFLIYGVVGQIDTVHGSLEELALPIGFLVGVTLLGVFFMRGARKITRPEGVVLLATYVAYVVFVSVGV